jgi:hypothetical protein
MADTNGPSDGERSLSPRIPSPASGSAAARQSLLLHLFQALNLNDRDGVASLEKSIEIAIASRHRALNDKNSPLLRLPTELIVAIGHLVMNGPQTVCPSSIRQMRPIGQGWQWRIGNFMHASSRLRQELDMVLNSIRVCICYAPIKPSLFVKECRRIHFDLIRYRGFSTKRPLAIYMSVSRHVSGSTAAAFAAFVECEVFGSRQTPLVVYAQAKYKRKRVRNSAPSFTNIFIGYARERSMKRMDLGLEGGWKERRIPYGEAKVIWKRLEEASLSKP